MDFLGIGPLELVLILLVFLIFVGPGKLPEIAAFLGKAYRKLKQATTELSREVKEMGEEAKSAGGEIKTAANPGGTSSDDLKGAVRGIQDARKAIRTVLDPRAGLVGELKEIAKDIAAAGADVVAAVGDKVASTADSKGTGKEARDVPQAVSAPVQLSPEVEVKAQLEKEKAEEPS